jgi:predicted RNA polymerase sigma factor
MVLLNYAMAVSMVHGLRKGLDLLDAVERDDRMRVHHRLDAVRAHLLELAGEAGKAITH